MILSILFFAANIYGLYSFSDVEWDDLEEYEQGFLASIVFTMFNSVYISAILSLISMLLFINFLRWNKRSIWRKKDYAGSNEKQTNK